MRLDSIQTKDFLPMSPAEAKEKGWPEIDIVLITGDAYVDHPSFGVAIIGRVLENAGYRVGIISQPRWTHNEDFQVFGPPRLFFGITAGNLGSMLNLFTVAKKPRSEDAYSPNGWQGRRPKRATIVYATKVREIYPDAPIVIGGIEASLRRFAHYDYWDHRIRPSILIESHADILVYGMGEQPVCEIAAALASGKSRHQLDHIHGTAVVRDKPQPVGEHKVLPSCEVVTRDTSDFCLAFRMIHEEQDPENGCALVQQHGNKHVVVHPPALPPTEEKLDDIYGLPFTRRAHPSMGKVPALQPVRFSITSHRGCFGDCAFCALAAHQGRTIQNRSMGSIVEEAQTIVRHPDFKGAISDVGGPTANMYGMRCRLGRYRCPDRQCLLPKPCENLDINHENILDVLRVLRNMPEINKVFVSSGIRYDLVLADESSKYLEEVCQHHISGLMKVAPEHIADHVLDAMNKPRFEVYQRFCDRFKAVNKKLGKEQYLVSYWLSGHPGCDVPDMIALAEYFRDTKTHPEQVQDFYPAPMTLAACMFYTGKNPLTGDEVFVPRSVREKAMQRALMQYWMPENRARVATALTKYGRRDLAGNKPNCLIRHL
ncbi:MAG: YgiQ family radical SAM protein [Planctomycetes bacterium]|nr:YgiQ family radical SAM protein [Planctomycetota bacterium]